MSNLFPDVWASLLLRTTARHAPLMANVFGPVRRGHYLPPTEAQLRQFEDFKLRYNAIVAEGEAKGYLDHDPDGGAYFTTLHGEHVWDESEEDFAARRAEWEASRPTSPVTFPVTTDN